MTIAASIGAPAAPRSAWIVSRSYDLTFFVFSLLPPVALWAAFHVGLITGVLVYVVFQLAFNMPHNFQTWTMSVLDVDDRRKNGRRYAMALAVIALLFGGTMILSPHGAFPWARDALIYWGYYHLVRQHFGILRLYERRMAIAGAPATPLETKLYPRYLDVVCYAPLLIRFRDPELMTTHLGSATFHLMHPVLPPWAWRTVAAVYVATIAFAIVNHMVAWSRGRRELLPRALHLLSVTVCFALAALGTHDLIVAIAIVTSFHNLQYLGLVWFHNRTRASLAERDGVALGRNAPIEWLRADRLAPYFACTFGYGVCLVLPIAIFHGATLASLPITTVVALHYYVDARVWRFADYPGLARFLRLKG